MGKSGKPIHDETVSICKTCLPYATRKFNPRRGKSRREIPVPLQGEWIKTLKRSHNGSDFRCEVSGLPLEMKDYKSPLYITLDHDYPAGKGANKKVEYLAVAQVINDMKSDHSKIEFWRNIKALAEITKGGTPDHDIAKKHRKKFLHAKSGISGWSRGENKRK